MANANAGCEPGWEQEADKELANARADVAGPRIATAAERSGNCRKLPTD